MAETKPIRFNDEALNDISKNYIESRKDISELEVEVDKINNIDPLIVIRAVSSGQTPDVADLCNIAELLFDGSTIKFIHKDTVVKSVIYAKGQGNRLTLAIPESYLIDKLLDVTYAILLKKSTPQ
jgi:hypothetical protein